MRSSWCLKIVHIESVFYVCVCVYEREPPLIAKSGVHVLRFFVRVN